ncbi:MAG: GGDEF domain-containing protein [Rhodocyclaceae bacterium]|nr:GGDEF domain-containing protein [Rhodocyclaceae bacterium]
MNIDLNTVLIVNVVNVMVLALTVPLMMGQKLSIAARSARLALIVNALGWICMIASNNWPEQWQDHVLSTFAVTGYSVSNWLYFRGVAGWLGPRPLARSMLALTFLIPVVYAALFPSYALRVGWSNFMLAAQMLIIARAAVFPAHEAPRNWRWVVVLASASAGIFTIGRGILGAFTDLYPSFLTPHPWNIAAMISTNVSLLLLNFALLIAWRQEAELALRQLSVTDPLTGVHNRRGWYEVAAPLIAQTNRLDQPLALLMLDLDHFKQINDAHGHSVGDQALQLMGRVLSQGRRGSDVVARLGGEEFAVLLPMADQAAAQNLDQRLRSLLTDMAPSSLPCVMNFSSGLAMLRRPGETLEQLMNRADAALYAAKHSGRGQIAISD